MSEINDWGAMFSIPDELLMQEGSKEYIQYNLERMEKDAIYQAVKQVEANKEGWIWIKPVLQEIRNPHFGVDYRFVVHCRPVGYSRVYIPIYENQSMPKDVFKCSWCGGFTKNDQRGHCAGCGGPRDDSYLEVDHDINSRY